MPLFIIHFFIPTVTQSLAVNCPATQTGQYQCNQATVMVNFPVATTAGGSGTVSAVTYTATGSSFTAPTNNQVTGTFPTSSTSHQVTATATDSAGTQSCVFLVTLSQGNNCKIRKSGQWVYYFFIGTAKQSHLRQTNFKV